MTDDLNIPGLVSNLLPNLREGVTVSDIDELFVPGLGGGLATQMNVIPSNRSGDCAEKLVIFCLKGSRAGRGKGHISFREGIECMVRHMQGEPCRGTTKQCALLTSTVDPSAIDAWEGNLKAMRADGRKIEFLILGTRGIASLPI